MGSIPGSGRSPGEGHGNPHQCSCLENPMDRGAWRATFCQVAKSGTQWNDQQFLFHVDTCIQGKNECMLRKGNFIRCKLNLNGIYFLDRPTRFHMFCCWLGLSQFKVSLCWKSIDFLNSWTFPRLTSWLSSGRMRTFHASYSICWESLLCVSFPYVYFQLYRSAIFSHSQLRQLWCLVLEIPAVPNCW